MKKANLILISFILLILGCEKSSQLNQEITSLEDELILVGKIDLQGLSEEPYAVWFNENYMNYTVDMASLEGANLDDIHIKMFLGTWCSDSQLQVPQFYKILTALEFDKSRLEMTGLEKQANGDLTSPQKEEDGLDIGFVPTMIFYRDGEEIGRIIEFPEESLEKDLARIVNNTN
ncbi:MAG: thiol reductase thioredoxin [Saprospiraceae bacterium]|nr:thiol reductase thioredoxin [Saprospiraceae bacterium]